MSGHRGAQDALGAGRGKVDPRTLAGGIPPRSAACRKGMLVATGGCPVAKSESAGAALERTIRRALPPGVELDEREDALLAAAAQQADAIAALEKDIEARGHMVDGARAARC